MDNTTASNKPLKILILVLASILAIMIWQFIDKQVKYNALQESSSRIQQYLQAEKDSLTVELTQIRDSYDSLRTNNDSMNIKLEMQQLKIDQLLRLRADNLFLISKYKKEIGTLREVLRNYVVQVDSLLRIKQFLLAENTDVKQKLNISEQSNKQLQEEKKELQTKVSKAAALSAKDIVFTGLNKNGKEKDEADKIIKLRVCFTLRENSLSAPGNRTVYLRITRPDDVVLTSSEGNIIEINGLKTVYSDKRDVNYQNTDVDMCIYYDPAAGELIPGNYKIQLYSEGMPIGESSFALRSAKGLFGR